MTAVVTAILGVFTSIGEWIVSTVSGMQEIFWVAGTSGTGGTLTLLGTLAVCGLGVSVIFLLIGIIQRFFHFAG